MRVLCEKKESNMAGAPKGNKNKTVLTTPELKKEAFKQYCDHLAAGFPKRTWTFKHPTLSLGMRSMENYIKNYPIDFPISQVEIALAKGENKWIEMGMNMMLGKIEGKVQPAIFQIMMRNIYKWDREDLQHKTVKTEAELLLRSWKGDVDLEDEE